MRIMVIDDDPFVRAVTETALAQLGRVTVRAFAGGAAALAAAAEFQPDAVVLDLRMADMDGCTTWARLKAAVSKPVRLIILTGDETATACADVNAMKPIGFITKPFEPAVMAATVARLLGIATPVASVDQRAAVTRGFRASLPATAQAITDALLDFRSGSDAAREVLLAQAHRLAGSASLFGHADLGRLADRIEGYLRAPARGEPVDVSAVHDACAALAHACVTAARDDGAG